MVFQSFHLFPLLTALVNVSFQMEYKGVGKKEACSHSAEILRHLAHEENFCMIIVTHDMDIAQESDHVWWIEDGEMRQEI